MDSIPLTIYSTPVVQTRPKTSLSNFGTSFDKDVVSLLFKRETNLKGIANAIFNQKEFFNGIPKVRLQVLGDNNVKYWSKNTDDLFSRIKEKEKQNAILDEAEKGLKIIKATVSNTTFGDLDSDKSNFKLFLDLSKRFEFDYIFSRQMPDQWSTLIEDNIGFSYSTKPNPDQKRVKQIALLLGAFSLKNNEQGPALIEPSLPETVETESIRPVTPIDIVLDSESETYDDAPDISESETPIQVEPTTPALSIEEPAAPRTQSDQPVVAADLLKTLQKMIDELSKKENILESKVDANQKSLENINSNVTDAKTSASNAVSTAEDALAETNKNKTELESFRVAFINEQNRAQQKEEIDDEEFKDVLQRVKRVEQIANKVDEEIKELNTNLSDEESAKEIAKEALEASRTAKTQASNATAEVKNFESRVDVVENRIEAESGSKEIAKEAKSIAEDAKQNIESARIEYDEQIAKIVDDVFTASKERKKHDESIESIAARQVELETDLKEEIDNYQQGRTQDFYEIMAAKEISIKNILKTFQEVTDKEIQELKQAFGTNKTESEKGLQALSIEFESVLNEFKTNKDEIESIRAALSETLSKSTQDYEKSKDVYEKNKAELEQFKTYLQQKEKEIKDFKTQLSQLRYNFQAVRDNSKYTLQQLAELEARSKYPNLAALDEMQELDRYKVESNKVFYQNKELPVRLETIIAKDIDGYNIFYDIYENNNATLIVRTGKGFSTPFQKFQESAIYPTSIVKNEAKTNSTFSSFFPSTTRTTTPKQIQDLVAFIKDSQSFLILYEVENLNPGLFLGDRFLFPECLYLATSVPIVKEKVDRNEKMVIQNMFSVLNLYKENLSLEGYELNPSEIEDAALNDRRFLLSLLQIFAASLKFYLRRDGNNDTPIDFDYGNYLARTFEVDINQLKQAPFIAFTCLLYLKTASLIFQKRDFFYNVPQDLNQFFILNFRMIAKK